MMRRDPGAVSRALEAFPPQDFPDGPLSFLVVLRAFRAMATDSGLSPRVRNQLDAAICLLAYAWAQPELPFTSGLRTAA